MEGLGLVELETVQTSDLVSVSVLLSSPEGAVPVLAVRAIARGKFVALQISNFQHLRVIELHGIITGSPVVLDLG